MTASSEKEFVVPPSGGRGSISKPLPPEGGTTNLGLAIEPRDPRRARRAPGASAGKSDRVRAIDETARGLDLARSEMWHRCPRANAPGRVTRRYRLSFCAHSRSKSSSAKLRQARFRRLYEAQGRETVLPRRTFRPPFAPPRARRDRPIPDPPRLDEARPRRPAIARSARSRNHQRREWKADAALRGHVRWPRLCLPLRSPSIAPSATNGAANKIDASVRRCDARAVRARAGGRRPELRPPQGIRSDDRSPADV